MRGARFVLQTIQPSVVTEVVIRKHQPLRSLFPDMKTDEKKGRTTSTSRRAALATEPNTTSPKKNTYKKSSLPVSTSTPVRPHTVDLKTSPILTKLSDKVAREGTLGPLLSNSLLPDPVHQAVTNIHEELNETKRSLKLLSLNAQHLILDGSLENCIRDLEKLHALLQTEFGQLNSKLDTLLSKPDPTEGILRGVEALLLKKHPTPTAPPNTKEVTSSIEALAERLDTLSNDNRKLTEASCDQLNKALALKMDDHNARVLEVILKAPPPASLIPQSVAPTVSVNCPPFMPALEKALDLIFKSPLLKDGSKKLDPIWSTKENFAPDLHESLLDLCNELEFTAEGGHRVSSQGASYKYWKHVLNNKNSKSTTMHAVIIALINHIKEAYPNCPVPNSCLINMFDGPTAYLAEHEDNENCLDPTSNIYTLSLGDIMDILFSSSLQKDADTLEFTPNPGSLYVMSVASQALWRHRIEHSAEFTGKRLSITLRTVDERFRKSTVILGDSNTKYINFGQGNGSLGYGVPGKRVEAMKVSQIDPLSCAGYSNVIIHCALNDLKSNRPQPEAVFDHLLSVTQSIRLVCPRARICVSPILPSKMPIFNETALAFNKLLFNHIESEAKPSVTSLDLNCFLEHRSGCLINELGRYMSPDPFHLGRDGYRLLANIFKNMILGSNHRSGRRDSQSGIRPDSSSSRRSHPVTSRHSHSSQYSYS